jgi:CheY-like chemotaxis protein
MVSESSKSNNNNGLNTFPEEFSDNRWKYIERYSIIILLCLIIAVLLISFDQRLFAGCIIIVAACLGVVAIRKASALIKENKESLISINSLNESKDQVIKDFSHKIRGPLNNLVMIVDMIMESDLAKEQKELIDSFIVSTNNMVSTVNDLTKQSAGNMGYEHRKSIRFNLLSTIQNTLDLYNLKDKVNANFLLDNKKLSDFECVGDPILLHQIFLTIFRTIENKVSEKATKVTINLGKAKITDTEDLISLKIQTDSKIILIEDSGVERSQSARLISAGRGTFSQEFGPDFTILTIHLPFTSPILKPKSETASLKIEELILKDKVYKELKDLKILLVEDNLINKNITLLTLKHLVHSIDTASNGKEALDKFGTTNYDLILMDIQMPVMSGLIAAEKIRALESTTNSHIPIIAITANAMVGDMEKCLSAGIDDYISKPFQPSTLVETIKRNIQVS